MNVQNGSQTPAPPWVCRPLGCYTLFREPLATGPKFRKALIRRTCVRFGFQSDGQKTSFSPMTETYLTQRLWGTGGPTKCAVLGASLVDNRETRKKHALPLFPALSRAQSPTLKLNDRANSLRDSLLVCHHNLPAFNDRVARPEISALIPAPRPTASRVFRNAPVLFPVQRTAATSPISCGVKRQLPKVQSETVRVFCSVKP